MRRVAIIQARMTSSRLPGKVLEDLAGRPMLAHVIERARAARRLDDVWVACTDLASDDPLADWCHEVGVPVLRGSEDDVLGRYVAAAAAADAGLIVRLTGDCPLLDPAVIDQVVEALELSLPAVDYAANVLERSYPRGLDVEAFTGSALARMNELGRSSAAREHVTIPVRLEHPQAFRTVNVRAPVDDSDLRWTVDTAADLAFVRFVYRALRLGRRPMAYRDLVRWCRANHHLVRHDDAGHTWDPGRPANTGTEGKLR